MEKNILTSKFIEKFSPRCQWKTCSMGNPFCMGNRDQNNADLLCQWVGMSAQHKTPLFHQRHAGEKQARDIVPPGLQNFARPKFPSGGVAFSVSKGEILFPWNSLLLLYRTMGRGKQQLEFLLYCFCNQTTIHKKDCSNHAHIILKELCCQWHHI